MRALNLALRALHFQHTEEGNKMKNHTLSIVLLFSFFGMSIQALAQTGSTTSQTCSDLMNICQTAGYIQNGLTGKNILVNCITPLINGQEVVNVHATPAQIETCKTELNNLPCAKIFTQCRAAGFTGGPGKLAMFDCIIPLVKGLSIAGVNPDPDDFKVCKEATNKEIQSQPCLRVMLACKQAGFSPDQVNGTAFARNCYGPILDGQQVPGVYIDDATVQACAKQSPSGTRPAPTQ